MRRQKGIAQSLTTTLVRENEGLVSLGTSDTVLVSTSAYRPDPDFHAFFHPAQIVHPSIADGNEEQDDKQNTQTPMRYFNMLVYKNGSLAREHVRDEYFQGSWEKFNHAVETSRPQGSDALPSSTAFWWLKPDIIVSIERISKIAHCLGSPRTHRESLNMSQNRLRLIRPMQRK